ncbi:MAG: ATP-binding protein [Rhodobacteraceae bacterium]|nr:ATP-binding protein [Paracoccaceae bacterium]
MKTPVHMITGLTGAGKSTYAEALARDISGVRMSIDDWMANLFFMERSPTSDFDWFYERVQRCCAQMRATAEQVLEAGRPVVFDCGFTNAHERGIFYDWADGLGHGVCLHYLDVSPEIRWRRVEQRNAERGPTFALEVTREMFDFMSGIWQAPTPREMAERNGQHVN